MDDQPKDLIDALQATPATVAGVLCHLRDSEERAHERLLAMRDQDDPFLAEYDQDAWARERSYEAADFRETLDAFTRHRAAHLVALASLDELDWHRTGRHEGQGSITISGHTLHIVSHDAIHCAQIARQLGA